MDILRRFYEDSTTREALRAFMIETLENMAVRKVFKGDSTVGLMESRILIDKMFEELEVRYDRGDKYVHHNNK